MSFAQELFIPFERKGTLIGCYNTIIEWIIKILISQAFSVAINYPTIYYLYFTI